MRARGSLAAMRRADRLARIITVLRQAPGAVRAEDLAARLGVSSRTLYRDMDRLTAAGVPVEGRPGAGYRLAEVAALPPLTLAPDELEALQLGIAIVAEADDPGLRGAAERLAGKIDAALSLEPEAEGAAWRLEGAPRGDAARGFSLMGRLRSAIRGRQKLEIVYSGEAGRRRVRPLRLDHAGRIWTLTTWDETRGDFAVLRVDLMERAEALPELFVDEPGKRLADFDPL